MSLCSRCANFECFGGREFGCSVPQKYREAESRTGCGAFRETAQSKRTKQMRKVQGHGNTSSRMYDNP